MLVPAACLAQGGGGAGGGGAGASGAGSAGSGLSGSGASGPGAAGSGTSAPGAVRSRATNSIGAGGPAGAATPSGVGTNPGNAAGTAPAARPVLPPAPAQNSNMTWDGDRLRPIDGRQSHHFYPRARTALTPFDVRPFSGTYVYDGY
jgi:hypothetical protein